MTPIEQLRHEHDAIKLMLAIVAQLCARLQAGHELNTAHFDQALEFIRVFADKCHHAKEEEFLFPALEEAGVPRHGGPIGVMLSEHDQGRALIARLVASWEGHKAGDPAARAEVVASAREYSALLTQHIEKENNILFPIAAARLSAETSQALLESFERLEVERIGEGRHEEFHKLLTSLKAAYLW